MQKDNEKKDWSVVDFPVVLRLWFAGWCKMQGKTITKGLEEVLNKLKEGKRK
jgi:hypothetical protein